MDHRVARTDADMRQDVLSALRADPVIATAPVTATVHDGIVSLHGHVWNRNEKIAATAAAASVAGVRGVITDIEVREPSPEHESDATVAIRVKRALEQHAFVPRGSIAVTVDRGAVTLTGVVAYEHQRLAAGQAMLDLVGVRQVINRVCVEPDRSVGAAVASAISSALADHDAGVARRIAVTVDRGTVMLRGSVATWGESRRAEVAARGVPGVGRVLNLIIVQGLDGRT
jgi:osmotically-inducible protein OsmY